MSVRLRPRARRLPLAPRLPLPRPLVPAPAGQPPRASRCVTVPRPLGALAGLRVTRVHAYNEHSLALTAEGYVYGWGSGSEGQLGPAVIQVVPLGGGG